MYIQKIKKRIKTKQKKGRRFASSPDQRHQRPVKKGGVSGVKGSLIRKQKEEEDVSDSVEERKPESLGEREEGRCLGLTGERECNVTVASFYILMYLFC